MLSWPQAAQEGKWRDQGYGHRLDLETGGPQAQMAAEGEGVLGVRGGGGGCRADGNPESMPPTTGLPEEKAEDRR